MVDRTAWGIVATVAEPGVLIQAFVAHHLSLGAAEIHVYFDDAKDPAADLVEGIPRVHVTRCNRHWWQSLGLFARPKRQNNRQSLNASHAERTTGAGFLLHCDADEFLRPGTDMVTELARLPQDRLWIKVFNLERAYLHGVPRRTIFDGVFKCHYQDQDRTELHVGPLTPFGFTGHAAGKALSRVGRGLTLGIHVPRRGSIKERDVPAHLPAEEVELVHFDGLTPLHWAAKFLRQAAVIPEFIAQLPTWRTAQAEAIFAVVGRPGGIEALYDRINSYSAEEAERLMDLGYMVDDPFELGPAIAAAFPGQVVDLSPAAFDATLMPRVEGWIAQARANGMLPG